MLSQFFRTLWFVCSKLAKGLFPIAKALGFVQRIFASRQILGSLPKICQEAKAKGHRSDYAKQVGEHVYCTEVCL